MDILGTVTFASDTGLTEDSVVNTFAFNQIDSDDLAGLATALIAFYNSIPSGNDRVGSTLNNSLAKYLSPTLNITTDMASVKLYEIPGGGLPLGSPELSQAFTLAAPAAAATALPSEVALALTVEAAGRADAAVETSIGTRPKQRFTGRIFLGPLNNTAVQVVSGVARPHTDLQDTLLQAGVTLDAAVGALSPAADWAVWSRTDNVVRSVGHVSVDNSFDTQRRRGESPTARRRVAVASA